MDRSRRLAVTLALFGLVVTIGLLQPTGLFAPFDMLAMKIVDHLRVWPGAGLLTSLALLLDRIGQGGGLLLIAMVLAMVLARGGRPRAMLWLIATVAAMILINPAIKQIFAAPRPDAITPLIIVASPSFPSGHAAGAMTIYGAIALLWPNRIVALICAAMILATGLSRVWLGVHWPSDVIGGWIEGAAWLAAMLLALPERNQRLKNNRIGTGEGESSMP